MGKLNLVLTQSEKGGCGKSTVMQVVVAGLTAGGTTPLVADADDGNSGYIRAAGKGSAVPLAWTLCARDVTRWLDSHARDCDTLAIDCGANIIASGAPINEFLGELIVRAKAAGGQITALAVACTNAPGVGRLVEHMRDAYGNFADVITIRNNQDGSGSFPQSLATLGMPTASFGHLASGIQAARLLSTTPLLQALQAPPPGYAVAMARYASVAAQFIKEPALSRLFDATALPVVEKLAANNPGGLSRVVVHLSKATDGALLANRAIWEARQALHHKAACRDDLEAIGKAALTMLDCEAAYDKMR